jgi:F-type H+-transporting ATPase subunit gamma
MSRQVQLKQKIKSIQTTKKITHAIRLVSMSLYAKLGHQTPFIENYAQKLTDLFYELLQYNQDWQNPLLPNNVPDTNPLFMVISTSKGLCGGLNSNLCKFIPNYLASKKITSPKFITIGLKAPKFIQDYEIGEIILSYNDFNSNNYLSITSDFVEKLINKTIPFTSITIFYNESKSFFIQKPTAFRLLPLDMDPSKIASTNPEKKHGSRELIWEQDSSEILNYLSFGYIKGQVINILLKALASEYSARFLAMDNSTTNAEKYIERLTLQYNKMRQAEITKEISTLCSGFMS